MSHRPSRRETLAYGISAVSCAPILTLLGGCGGAGGTVAAAGQGVAAKWVQTLLDCVSASGFGPPMVARAIGVTTTAMYDAWAAYDAVAVGTRFGGQLRQSLGARTLANKEKAVSYAAFRVLLDLFPDQASIVSSRMRGLGYDMSDTSGSLKTPQGVGNRVAREIIAFRHEDGSNQLGGYADTTGYVPVNTPDTIVDPSRWQPLRFANGKAPGFIGPHWKDVIPFAISSPSSIRPPDPPAFGSPTYLAGVEQVLDVTARIGDREKVIAEYWADGPKTVLPPGHSILFGLFVSSRDRFDLDQDIKLFFMLGNAMLDSAIACWECKRFFDASRPITAIRALMAGKKVRGYGGPGVGIVDMMGEEWMPYQSPNFVTPPFPEYSSGHSTFSSAGAEILKRVTGSDAFGFSVTIPPSSSTFDPDVPARPVTLSFPTFTDYAEEAGISRLYGGIHFNWGDLEGRRCGRQVGEIVFDKATRYIRGTEIHAPVVL
ncbi:MAG: vanadium-dependent haloperoxidase [Fimbriimonadaceae bacterium]